MRKTYPSDVTDQQWDIIEVLIPVNRLGRPREVSMREVVNTIFYLNRSGCQWDMLPHDLLPKSTVYDLLRPRAGQRYLAKHPGCPPAGGADCRRQGAQPQCWQYRQPDGQSQ